MLKRISSQCSSPPSSASVPVRGADHRAGARQGERRHPDEDRVRTASGRPCCAHGLSSPTSRPRVPSCRKAIAEVTPQLILEAVDELLLVQRGRELGLALGDEQFKSIVENIKKSNNIDSEDQFQAALKQEGMTMTDLRRALERQMLASRGAAPRRYGQNQRHRGGGARLLRGSQAGLHDTVGGHAPRDSHRRPRNRPGRQRRPGR